MKQLRRLGSCLLIAGFLWLCGSAIWLRFCGTAAASQFAKSIPPQESYQYSEVFGAFSRLPAYIQQEMPSVFVPALLMLSGAITLAHRPAVHRESRNQNA